MKTATTLGVFALTMGLAAAQRLEIVAAYFGGPKQFEDVTARLRELARPGGMAVPVNTFGNGWLRVYYKLDGTFAQGEWPPGETVVLGNPPAEVGNAANSVRVIRAVYGSGARTIDVASRIQGKIAGGRLELEVSNANMGGDPAPATRKELNISFEYQGTTRSLRIPEHDWLYLPEGAPPAGTGLKILRATYGSPNGEKDVTQILTDLISNDRITLTVSNSTLGVDPGRGDKMLRVVYEFRRRRFETRIGEGKLLSIPGMGAPLTR